MAFVSVSVLGVTPRVHRRAAVTMGLRAPGGGWASRAFRKSSGGGGAGGGGMGAGGGGGGDGGMGGGSGSGRKGKSGAGGAAGGGGNLYNQFMAWYGSYNKANPLATAAVTSAVALSLGDVLAQTLGGSDYCPTRTVRLALLGAAVHGPGLSTWFTRLDAALPGAQPFKIAAKTAAHAAVVTPLWVVATLAAESVVADGGVGGVVDKVKAGTKDGVSERWLVWPVVQAVNYAVVPVQLRVLFMGAVGVALDGVKAAMVKDS